MAEEKASLFILRYLVQGCLPSQKGFKVMQKRVTRIEREERNLQGLESVGAGGRLRHCVSQVLRAEKREAFSVALH